MGQGLLFYTRDTRLLDSKDLLDLTWTLIYLCKLIQMKQLPDPSHRMKLGSFNKQLRQYSVRSLTGLSLGFGCSGSSLTPTSYTL